MYKVSRHPSQNSGFTFVEMMVALVVSTILMALIIGSYWGQTRSSRDKQMIVEMQQNMRSAMFYMERDIKMAGYDTEFQDLASDTSILTASPTVFSFQSIDDDTGNKVTITYDLFDYLGDGDMDLAKQVDANPRIYVAQNIEALEFYYTIADGRQSTDPVTDFGADLEDIRAVGVSILVRGSKISSGDENHFLYSPVRCNHGDPFNDGIRRQILTTTVKCRNMFATI